jgi:hypothetical protein
MGKNNEKKWYDGIIKFFKKTWDYIKIIVKKIMWLIYEFIKVFSSHPSFFSKKRLESAASFSIGQFGMIFYLLAKYQTMVMTDFIMWAGVEFLIAGYIIQKIESAKKLNNQAKKEETEEKING